MPITPYTDPHPSPALPSLPPPTHAHPSRLAEHTICRTWVRRYPTSTDHVFRAVCLSASRPRPRPRPRFSTDGTDGARPIPTPHPHLLSPLPLPLSSLHKTPPLDTTDGHRAPKQGRRQALETLLPSCTQNAEAQTPLRSRSASHRSPHQHPNGTPRKCDDPPTLPRTRHNTYTHMSIYREPEDRRQKTRRCGRRRRRDPARRCRRDDPPTLPPRRSASPAVATIRRPCPGPKHTPRASAKPRRQEGRRGAARARPT
ncbi:hypothetical protein K438DRAFT_202801 [Mycena galopus ATCC 62051]|nr:hypothetical protein K438DRAFT_202801 [Mycena galopus ATCC 62051]